MKSLKYNQCQRQARLYKIAIAFLTFLILGCSVNKDYVKYSKSYVEVGKPCVVQQIFRNTPHTLFLHRTIVLISKRPNL